MFGTIRRHQAWLWVIIAIVTVISFVVFGPTTSSKIGSVLGGNANYGSIEGQPITRERFEEAQKDVFFLVKGAANADNLQIRKQIYARLFYIQQQEDLGIEISPEAAAAWAREHLMGSMTMVDFAEKVLKELHVDTADFSRFVRHEMAKQQLEAVAGVSGLLVTPGEAEALYRARNTEITASMVFLAVSNFMSEVKVTPEILGQFYSNELAHYRLPDQVQVNYVEFDVTNYLAAARVSGTNYDQAGKEAYDAFQKYGTNYFPDAKTADEAKRMNQAAYLTNQAILEARKAANAFADELGTNADGMGTLARTNGLTLHTTPPFDEDGPEGLTVPPDFIQAGLDLTNDNPVSGLVKGDDAIYVLGLKRWVPSSIPPLADIEKKVTADFRQAQAEQLLQQKVTVFHSNLTNNLNPMNGITLGQTFEDICAEAGFKSEKLQPFSLSTTNFPEDLEKRINPTVLTQVGFSTPPGTASQVIPARDGVFIMYVEKTTPVDESKVKAELPRFLAGLRQNRRAEAGNIWYNIQYNRAADLIDTMAKLDKDQSESAAPQRTK